MVGKRCFLISVPDTYCLKINKIIYLEGLGLNMFTKFTVTIKFFFLVFAFIVFLIHFDKKKLLYNTCYIWRPLCIKSRSMQTVKSLRHKSQRQFCSFLGWLLTLNHSVYRRQISTHNSSDNTNKKLQGLKYYFYFMENIWMIMYEIHFAYWSLLAMSECFRLYIFYTGQGVKSQ